ncbi:hypothetical protein CDD80_497 [Ophiocordyceps camponoti-rufipedis]|uniref:Uncharacterized protein n=1 Tax=Ophiocordyceps camponoti-rufipedis TaxID=2004952 RepID=A0A2C5XCY7_9HYPO|nr:hypothetical protein CDD80_497 [Ophiocordyceps camponoti-rufipedis]
MARYLLSQIVAAALVASLRQGLDLQRVVLGHGHGSYHLRDRLLKSAQLQPPEYLDDFMGVVPGLEDESKKGCFYQRTYFQAHRDQDAIEIRYHPNMDLDFTNEESFPISFTVEQSTAKIQTSRVITQTSDDTILAGGANNQVNGFPLQVETSQGCPPNRRCVAYTWAFSAEVPGNCTLVPFVDEGCLDRPWPKSGSGNTTVMSLFNTGKMDEDRAIADKYFDLSLLRSGSSVESMSGVFGNRTVRGQKNQLRDGLYWPDETKFNITYKQTPKCRVTIPLLWSDGWPIREQIIGEAQDKTQPETLRLLEEFDDETGGIQLSDEEPSSSTFQESYEEEYDDDAPLDEEALDREGEDMWLDPNDVDWLYEEPDPEQAPSEESKPMLEEAHPKQEAAIPATSQVPQMDTRVPTFKELAEEFGVSDADDWQGDVEEEVLLPDEASGAEEAGDELVVESSSQEEIDEYEERVQMSRRRNRRG